MPTFTRAVMPGTVPWQWVPGRRRSTRCSRVLRRPAISRSRLRPRRRAPVTNIKAEATDG